MRMIFVNLPVRDVAASRTFFARLGFDFNPDYSDGSCACMVIEANVFAMLLRRERFEQFSNNPVSDAFAATEVMTCVSVDTREQVDDIVAGAVATGGKAWRACVQQGPMYAGSFQDLDGHVWEVLHLAAG